MIDGVVDEIFLFGRKYVVLILWIYDVMKNICLNTTLMVNLRKLCEYAFDSYSVDDCLEQIVGKLKCVKIIILSPNRTLSCVRVGVGQHCDPFSQVHA